MTTPTPAEIAEAVSRYRRVQSGERPRDVYPGEKDESYGPTQQMDDLYRLADAYAAVMVVPHPDGSQTGGSPADVRRMLDELQAEWDGAERRLAECRVERDKLAVEVKTLAAQLTRVSAELSAARIELARHKLADDVMSRPFNDAGPRPTSEESS